MKAARKLIPAIALLLVAVVLMSSASFAWFTMSREVTATGMDVTVTAPNNLLISNALAGTYDSSATLAAVTGMYVKPASTIDGETYYVLQDGSTVIVADGSRLATSKYETGDAAEAMADPVNAYDATKEGAYVDFTYYIKTEGNDAVDVYVKEVNLTGTYTNGGTDDGLKAVRFALVDSFTTETGAAATTIAADNIWVPTGAAYATKTATDAYAIKDTEADGTVGAQTADKEGENVTNTHLDEVPAFVYGNAATADTVFSVAADAISVITIRVWIEGEDTNCIIDKAAEMNFDLEVVFAAK